MSRAARFAFALLVTAGAEAAHAQLSSAQQAANLESFDLVWQTVRDRHPDPKLNGLDWAAVRGQLRPRIAQASDMQAVRRIMEEMLHELGTSHYAIIPAALYGRSDVAPASDDEQAERRVALNAVEPAGASAQPEPARGEAAAVHADAALVTFGNLPAIRLTFESRRLAGGAGYIRFSEFLDPASVMPKIEAALREFRDAPGVALDLRGNPGGIGVMAMGVAGFFIDKAGQKLGEMKMRDSTLKFVIFPRPETYGGRLAILLDEGSASTTEILAGGLQDLGRARIFGTRSAGAALPSDVIRLPNGDGFQYVQASYTSEKGKALEGAGVTPDVVVRQTREAQIAGRDLVIEAAEAWLEEGVSTPK